uniref:Uncharacterized protein n=1 Tax=Arundo donax TaxID=35708 RepID=A0A0A9F7J1_ARUDO
MDDLEATLIFMRVTVNTIQQ